MALELDSVTVRYGQTVAVADVSLSVSLGMTIVFLLACVAGIAWIFRTGYRLKT